MKVILSRKGFDAELGGFASPILPDGRLVSLPVPALPGEDKRILYGDLRCGKNERIVGLLRKMGKEVIKIPGNKKRKSSKGKKDRWRPPEKKPAHLDPDLRKIARRRESGWKGLFGQSYASQTHLEKTCEVVKMTSSSFSDGLRDTVTTELEDLSRTPQTRRTILLEDTPSLGTSKSVTSFALTKRKLVIVLRLGWSTILMWERT